MNNAKITTYKIGEDPSINSANRCRQSQRRNRWAVMNNANNALTRRICANHCVETPSMNKHYAYAGLNAVQFCAWWICKRETQRHARCVTKRTYAKHCSAGPIFLTLYPSELLDWIKLMSYFKLGTIVGLTATQLLFQVHLLFQV